MKTMNYKIVVMFMVFGAIAISSRLFEVLVRGDVILSIIFGILTLGECVVIEQYIFENRKDI